MSSRSLAVDVLAKACEDGDPYSGLQTFKATLRRKIRIRDEAAAHALLVDAFQQVAVPLRFADAASDLASELFPILTEFGHKSDSFGLEKVRVLHDLFVSVPEREASTAWCQSHVQFFENALKWWRSGKQEQQQQRDNNNNAPRMDKEEINKSAVFLYEALCCANVRLFHSTESNEPAACAALACAYKSCLCCASQTELINSVVNNVYSRLTPSERPLLIARTIYGVLSGVGGDAATPPQSALITARALLAEEKAKEQEGGGKEEELMLHLFLHDVLLIFASVAKTPERPSASELGGKVVDALCTAYRTTLARVADLDWAGLLRDFQAGCVC